ncbi:MAG TPA: MmcQ/YjbR family DNA-binding protein [Kofleriaceae bacterium]|nr:MmcQ/YjbR family DNA-binding protein [Kofleriaceae bacterium]
MPTRAETALARVRALCLSFPGATERPSHGAPTFFVGKKSFLTFVDNHHGDGRLAIWCAAGPDAQAALVEADPEVFFVPPYVGHLGWIGARLDRKAPWAILAKTIEDAYATRASSKPARTGRR